LSAFYSGADPSGRRRRALTASANPLYPLYYYPALGAASVRPLSSFRGYCRHVIGAYFRRDRVPQLRSRMQPAVSLMADIYRDIETEVPALRRYARALTRDTTAADDLVQDCLARALVKLHLWREGSNLRAWLFTILHNQHVNDLRRTMRTGTPVELGEAEPRLSRPAEQDKRLELRDLERALARLPEEQRAAILLVGLEGLSYEDASIMLAIPVGTVRSRISRGRDALRILIGVAPKLRAEHAATKAVVQNRHRRSRAAGAGHPTAPLTLAH
jgi:RNA polymerase sigma factor (sigma-70 family)